MSSERVPLEDYFRMTDNPLADNSTYDATGSLARAGIALGWGRNSK